MNTKIIVSAMLMSLSVVAHADNTAATWGSFSTTAIQEISNVIGAQQVVVGGEIHGVALSNGTLNAEVVGGQSPAPFSSVPATNVNNGSVLATVDMSANNYGGNGGMAIYQGGGGYVGSIAVSNGQSMSAGGTISGGSNSVSSGSSSGGSVSTISIPGVSSLTYGYTSGVAEGGVVGVGSYNSTPVLSINNHVHTNSGVN